MNTKNLKISEDTHTDIKVYCSKNKLSLNEWVNDLIKLNLKYTVLVELLMDDRNIEYFENKLKSQQNTYTAFDEYEKTKKQLELLKESRDVFVKTKLPYCK